MIRIYKLSNKILITLIKLEKKFNFLNNHNKIKITSGGRLNYKILTNQIIYKKISFKENQ
jgi:hypothetical protein